MINIASEYFDLAKIADSGQCFRIVPTQDNRILAVSEERFVYASLAEDGSWQLDCTQQDYDEYWKAYFDMDRCYQDWFEAVDENDVYLSRAKHVGLGLRVVNQNPWETLVSFIISQRRSVPSITTCVNKVCRKYGRQVSDDVFLFPAPEDLASLSVDDMQDCSMGYRTEYVIDAARKVVSGQLDLAALETASDEELLQQLMGVKGVGIKVANCTALYGYHRLGLFPIDVWIKRVLDTHYPQGFPVERYDGFAGFMQLLMFYEARH